MKRTKLGAKASDFINNMRDKNAPPISGKILIYSDRRDFLISPNIASPNFTDYFCLNVTDRIKGSTLYLSRVIPV